MAFCVSMSQKPKEQFIEFTSLIMSLGTILHLVIISFTVCLRYLEIEVNRLYQSGKVRSEVPEV